MQAISGLLERFVTYIVDPAILLVFAGGFFLFMWGLVMFMIRLNSGEPTKNDKDHMLWGLAGMLIMVAVWGIIGLLENTFGIGRAGGFDVSRIENVAPPPSFFR